MNVVFLDIDGCVVPFKAPGKKARPAYAAESCVVALNRILQDAEAGIVVISEWRQHTTVAKLQACFKEWGIVGKIVGTTPVLFDRSKEILRWLEVNPDIVGGDSWITIDDEELTVPNFVRCDPMVGLTEDGADAALKILWSNNSGAEK